MNTSFEDIYKQHKSLRKIADHFSVSVSTVRRWAKEAGFDPKKAWTRHHGVVDGKKWCQLCKVRKLVKDFYKRSEGGVYSYCKSCDTKRAVETNRKNRKKKSDERNRIELEKRTFNLRSIELLGITINEIVKYCPGSPIVSEIKSHLIAASKLMSR